MSFEDQAGLIMGWAYVCWMDCFGKQTCCSGVFAGARTRPEDQTEATV